ncbi:hypothetical protein DFH27DRAFT_590734 [Peziza echinospora]|nr:hypothetical protein DFH27DRAFT_590734 [Peziza echinospora]
METAHLSDVSDKIMIEKYEISYRNLPKIHELPEVPGHINGSAWLWGPDDGLGRLNFLTSTRIQASLKFVKLGELIPLNLPVKLIDPPLFNRPAFNHKFTRFGDGSVLVQDEEFVMNTQTSTQLDGFHHFAHLPSSRFYNNCTGDPSLPSNKKCGIQSWASHGIAGRGILLDYAGYLKAKGITVSDPFSAHNITIKNLREVAQHQGIKLKTVEEGGDIQIGDILLIRSGFSCAYKLLDPAQRRALADRPYTLGPGGGYGFIGVDQSKEMVRWLHDSYFSLVVGDQPAFESWPPQGPLSLHEQILSLWGVALGEFFDLDRLATRCEEEKRWIMFFVSVSWNVEGGIASWGNAMAIL